MSEAKDYQKKIENALKKGYHTPDTKEYFLGMIYVKNMYKKLPAKKEKRLLKQ